MRGVIKRGKIYYISFGYKGKRFREPAGASFNLAVEILAKRKAEVLAGYHLGTIDKTNFENFAETYLQEYCKPKQTPEVFKHSERYIKEFKSYFGPVPLTDITVNDVEKWKAKRGVGKSPATINQYLCCLQTLFNQAKNRWNYFKGENPVRRGTKLKVNNKRIRYLSDEEREALLKEANPFLHQIIVFTINTGLRKGELQSLLWKQINLNQKIMYLTKTKGNKHREIPLNVAAMEILHELKVSHPPKGDAHVFGAQNGGAYGNWRKAFDGAVKRAKIQDFKFHDLRHTFASYLAMAGVDLNTIRELLGHSTYEMTERYTHLSMPHRHKAVETLNKLGR